MKACLALIAVTFVLDMVPKVAAGCSWGPLDLKVSDHSWTEYCCNGLDGTKELSYYAKFHSVDNDYYDTTPVVADGSGSPSQCAGANGGPSAWQTYTSQKYNDNFDHTESYSLPGSDGHFITTQMSLRFECHNYLDDCQLHLDELHICDGPTCGPASHNNLSHAVVNGTVHRLKGSATNGSSVVKQSKVVRPSAAMPDNTYCTACTEVVKEVQSDGCEAVACSAIPPPGDEICSWLLSASGVCQEIIKWLDQGLTPDAICKDLGWCGSACECGVCTQAGAGPSGRCLGAPNDCGHAQESSVPAFLQNKTRSGFCFDGQCGDPGSIGCCLTCF